MLSYTKKIFSDVSKTAPLNIINFSSNFVLAVLVSRFLGVEALGIFSFIFAFVMVLCVVTDFGLTTLLVRKINENRSYIKNSVSQFNKIKLVFSAVSLFILFAFGYFLSPQIFNLTFAAGILVIIPKSFQATYESTLRAELMQVYPTIIKSINSLLQLVAAYFLLVSGKGLFEIFLAVLFLESLTAFYLKFASGAIIKKVVVTNNLPNSESSLQIIKEASSFFFFNFFSISIPRINVILLEYMVSPSAVGIFSAAYRFNTGVGLFSGALSNSYYPLVSSIKDNLRLRYELTKKFVLYSFLLGFAFGLGLFLFSGLIIDLTFKIEEAKTVLKIISFAVIPTLVYTVLQAYFFSVYREKFIARLYAVIWFFCLFLSIALIWHHSYIGAAIVTISVEYLLLLVQLIEFFKSRKSFS